MNTQGHIPTDGRKRGVCPLCAPGIRHVDVGHNGLEDTRAAVRIDVGESGATRGSDAEEVSHLTGTGCIAAVALTVVSAAVGMTASPSVALDACIAQPNMALVEQHVCSDWSTYRNTECQFEIKYPPNWLVETTPDALVAGGAVVTLVPAYDPSLNELGNRTNLVSLSVTVSVTAPSGNMEAGTCRERTSDPRRAWPRLTFASWAIRGA